MDDSELIVKQRMFLALKKQKGLTLLMGGGQFDLQFFEHMSGQNG